MSVMNEELRVVVGASEHGVRVKIEGELDAASARLLLDVLEAAVDSEVGDVEIDMSMTTFCNSAGLAVLLAAHRQLHLAGRRLRIVHASRPALRSLDLFGTRPLLGPPPGAEAISESGRPVGTTALAADPA